MTTPIDYYANFVLHAVYGRLGEADYLMRLAGDQIREVADQLEANHPITKRPLYRGVLLDPTLGLGTHYPFVSWSEDREVARWFADPRSYISEPFLAYHPEARGYMLSIEAPRSRVLFHHAWADAFFAPLGFLAYLHPLMGAEGQRQIEWSLKTQREVITEPIEGLEAAPLDVVSDAAIAMLDRKLSPPWIDLQVAPEGHACGDA